MNGRYKDGSDCEVCEDCGFCITCGDCDEYGCRIATVLRQDLIESYKEMKEIDEDNELRKDNR